MQHANTGARPLSLAQISSRNHTIDEGRGVSRKELSAAGRAAAQALGLRPALRQLLDELIGAWGEQEVHGRLIVWPSNGYLADRTGLSERGLRYLIRQLIEAGVLGVRDSANGKRYARRGAGGAVIDAYGFDLTPVYARRGEWVEILAAQKAQRDAHRACFDEITRCRRAIEEALLALAQSFPGTCCASCVAELAALQACTPRRGRGDPMGIVDAWQALRTKVEDLYESAANGGKDCRQKETNNGSDTPSDKGLPRKAGADLGVSPGLVMEACPAVAEYGHVLAREDDIARAGRYLRSSIGAHESAWGEACAMIGPVMAGAAVIYVLQLHADDVAGGTDRIQNPGGYFRALTRMMGEGKVKLAVELERMRQRKMN